MERLGDVLYEGHLFSGLLFVHSKSVNAFLTFYSNNKRLVTAILFLCFNYMIKYGVVSLLSMWCLIKFQCLGLL